MTSEPTLLLNARFDRSLVNANGDSVRYLVVTAKAPDLEVEPTAPREPLNLAIVIDASGSMAGAPLEAAKTATIGVVESLQDSDRLSIVSFASDILVHADAVRTDEAGKRRIIDAVRTLVTRGSTNLADGWLKGCECVAREQANSTRGGRNQVILLSDGHANQGETNPQVLEQHANELRSRGVLTSTVGIGTGYSPVQLQAISEAGGGRMHDAERPEEIVEVVLAELQETLRTSVENLEVEVAFPTGVRVALFGASPNSQIAGRLTVVLGSMVAGATRKLVVKLTLPAGKLEEKLALEMSAKWKWPGDPTVQQSGPQKLELKYASPEACENQPRDQDTARTVAEQWQAHVIRTAMILNQDGEYQKAVAYANQELAWFERYCRELPATESMVDLLRRYAPSLEVMYSAVSSKEVMLSTHKSSRGERDHRSASRGDYGSHIPPQP